MPNDQTERRIAAHDRRVRQSSRWIVPDRPGAMFGGFGYLNRDVGSDCRRLSVRREFDRMKLGHNAVTIERLHDMARQQAQAANQPTSDAVRPKRMLTREDIGLPPVNPNAETLRDRFAMAALGGMLGGRGWDLSLSDELSVTAYRFADAMMKARTA